MEKIKAQGKKVAAFFTANKKHLLFGPNKGMYVIVISFLLFSLGSSIYILSVPVKKKVVILPQLKTLSLPTPTAPLHNQTPTPGPVTALTSNGTTATPIPIVTLPPTIAVTPTPVSSTSAWSSISSKQYGFSIQYPTDWTAVNQDQLEPLIPEYIVFNPKIAPATSLSITLSYSTRTYQQALAIDPQAGTQITVASVSATKKIHTDSDGNTSVNVTVPYKNNTTIIFAAKQQYATILTQMLSTLIFTN